MRRVGPWRVLTSLMIFGAAMGCRTPSLPSLPSFAPPKPVDPIGQVSAPVDGSTEAKEKELPPDETSRVCITTAEELAKNGDEFHAILLYEKARKLNPKCQVSRKLAVLYDRQGDFQKAQEEYLKALKKTPKDADLLNDMGYGYYSRGRWAEAEKYLRQALTVKPGHQHATMNLGLCVGEQGHYDEALELFGKVVSPAQARCNLAFILTTQHKWSEAKRVYQEALHIDPDIPLARAALAKLEKAERQAAAPVQTAQMPLQTAQMPVQTAQMPVKPEGIASVGYVQFDEAPADNTPEPQTSHSLPPPPALQ
jgi:Tfp pilus assembly protein PilF